MALKKSEKTSTSKKTAATKTTQKKTSTTAKKTTPVAPEPDVVEVKTPNKAAINSLVTSLCKKFGTNAVNLGVPRNEDGTVKDIPRLETGSIALDVALGGGIPVGRYTEISGALSTTKSTQTAHIISSAQKSGMVCALCDAEGTFDEKYLRACGVNVDSLIYFRPDGLEEATEIMLTLQRSGDVQLGVFDSWAAMSPTKEMQSGMDESTQMGLVPRLMGEYFRKYTMLNNRLEREGKTPFTVIGLNQIREKIGAYGDAEYTPGGRAKGFTATVDIRFRRGDWIKEGVGVNERIVGQVVKFKIEKNKLYKRMQTGEFDFYFDRNKAGVRPNYNDNEKSIIMLAVQYGLVERAGAWFKYNEEKYQGVASLIDTLRHDKDLYSKLRSDLFTLLAQVPTR